MGWNFKIFLLLLLLLFLLMSSVRWKENRKDQYYSSWSMSHLPYAYIYQGYYFTSRNLLADIHWIDIRCGEYIYICIWMCMSLRISDLKYLKKWFYWFIRWHIAAGRKRWMTLMGPTFHHMHTHAHIYHTVYRDVRERERVCVCKHRQSMHKLAIPVFALGRPSVSACSLSDFFSSFSLVLRWMFIATARLEGALMYHH